MDHTSKQRYFSDLVVDFLHQQDIGYVSFNPGASFRGIHDSLVYAGNAEIAPAIVMTCHEEIAVAVAHGYFKASGRHMAVLIHANVGLLHASMAIFNAWCDRVPLLLIGGNGPIDASKRRPWIDWIHTSSNIEAAVKDFVKWSDQPIGQAATLESLYRALRLMQTGQPAPVFIAVDFDVQEQPLLPELRLLPRAATRPAALPALGGEDVRYLLERLSRAVFPLLILDFQGRHPETVALLLELVEKLDIAVIDRGNRFNFPNQHVNNCTHYDRADMAACDFIVAIEVQDLEGALLNLFPESRMAQVCAGTEIVTIDCNDLLVSKWAADYQRLVPVSRAFAADTAATLRALVAALNQQERAGAATQAGARRRQFERQRQLRTLKQQAERAAHDAHQGLHAGTAVAEIGKAVREENWVLTNTGSLTIDALVKKTWTMSRPGCYLGLNGGGGLGYGLGASIGAALALKDSGEICIDLQSDGDFLYTPSGLWTLSAYAIPLLVIVMNNQLYLNSTQHAERIAGERDRDIHNAHIATSFHECPVDFTTLAQSFNVKVFPAVTEDKAVAPAVRAAIEHIKQHRRPVVIEFQIL